MPITIPFSDLIDLEVIIERHHGDEATLSDDTIYLVNIDPDSEDFGEAVRFDVGQGHFPLTLEDVDGYWGGDARGDTISLLFDEHDEDLNGNGVLDQGEDTDLDGVLDTPNYLPGVEGTIKTLSLSERARALMTFYERETDTLILRPLRPLRQRTRYAVVVTQRLTAGGEPVGSPYAGINHNYHSDALAPLEGLLRASPDTFGDLTLSDVAFAWTFTTGTIEEELKVVREGLYGHGVQAHLAEAFPAELDEVHELWSDGPQHAFESVYTLSGETFSELLPLAVQAGLVGGNGSSYELMLASTAYVDYHVFGTFISPQLYERTDKAGNHLGWDEMVWPPDVSIKAAPARPERVTFWMTVPRKEVSARGEGKPAPLVILGHGYTSNKSELIEYHGAFASRGLATLCMDNASHGVDLSDLERKGLEQLLSPYGAAPFGEALTDNRAMDHDGNGSEDSGADFWTSYAFHTRDVVRQTAVDYMQLIRILRSYDGEKTWTLGPGDIAGDFDGDGRVDIGGSAPLTMTGASLGGIMAAVMAGIEPELSATVPIAGGAGLSDIGNRSLQGGVRESVQLRLMGPLYVGERREDGGVDVMSVVPRLNRTARIPVATIPPSVALKAGDSLLVENLDNGEYDCALVLPDPEDARNGIFRLGVASDILRDAPQRHRITVWPGLVFDASKRDEEKQRACALLEDAPEPKHMIDAFEFDTEFFFRGRALSFAQGDPLSPLAEGLGLHRARPALRRFMSFAQMILDPGDPATYAQHVHSGEMRFSDGSVVETSMVVLNTIGDMNVPVSTGANIGRAAGFIDHVTPIESWGGRTLAQVLVDTSVLEAVDSVGHYTSPDGQGVLFDPEDLSDSAAQGDFDWSLANGPGPISYNVPLPRGEDGYWVPRLSPPLRDYAIFPDPVGGYSGTFFPFIKPRGQHGPDSPGYHKDIQTEWCVEETEDPTLCESTAWYDNGAMISGIVGRYLASGGTEFPVEACFSAYSCEDEPTPPAPR